VGGQAGIHQPINTTDQVTRISREFTLLRAELPRVVKLAQWQRMRGTRSSAAALFIDARYGDVGRDALVPSLIEGLRVVQGLRAVPVFLPV